MANKLANTILQKEDRVELAAEKYFRLFGKDWAEQHRLNQTAQEELLEMLKDAYFFLDEMAEAAPSFKTAAAADETLTKLHNCFEG